MFFVFFDSSYFFDSKKRISSRVFWLFFTPTSGKAYLSSHGPGFAVMFF